MLTPRELQTLRNQGGLAEEAADTIDRIVAAVRAVQSANAASGAAHMLTAAQDAAWQVLGREIEAGMSQSIAAAGVAPKGRRGRKAVGVVE